MVAFDIDYFKRINDEWGHEIGDRVLAGIGHLLERESRDIDVTARFGGEEFVVLLPSCTSADAQGFAERVRGALEREPADGLPTVRMSAGVLAAVAPSSLELMLHGADSALYSAKRSGRDRTVVSQHAAQKSRAPVFS